MYSFVRISDVWNLSITHAGGIINIWDGITPALDIMFAFFVDTFMGDYYMLVLSSIAYTIGLAFLSMSTPPVLGPCGEYKAECIGHTQKVLFFTALALIAVGIAGQEVSLSFLIDHAKSEDEEGNHDMLSRILAVLIVVVVSIFGGIARPFSMPWSIRFFVPSIFMLVATVVFLSGCLVYKRSKPEGSPLTVTLRVFVAAARNISHPYPDSEQLYNDEDAHSTSTLRCLDKAAINLPEQSHSNNWKLCSVREVEDTKIGIRMVPMWLTFIVIGIVLSIGNTYFLEQANRMDRKLGKIKVPIPFFLLLYISSSYISSYFYSLLTVCLPNKKYAPRVGIATAMVCSVLCCITAAKVEARRLLVIRDHGLLDRPDERTPMGVLCLLPQFVILAAVDGIANTSITNLFIYQAPKSMRKYLMHFTKGVLGLGTILAGVLSVHIVGKVTR